MLFNSIVFLYAFLPAAYLVFWRLRSRNQRYVWLTITGYVFYAFWDYRFCALMAFSTVVSYLAGRGMLRWDQRPSRRRLCLVVPVVADLALLGFFKYAGFALEAARRLTGAFGLRLDAPALHIILPIGISFYTFHTISYIVDSYRRTIVPTRNFFEFSCYVSLFCQLVAGPIVRFRQIEADLEAIDVADRRGSWQRGWSFFALGMIKKVLVADTIAAIINPALARWTTLSTGGAWLAMLGYTMQLYFDFSGYSDMAVGLGALFGLRIPQNFNSPYKATDPSDFWRRWHISLSSCLRDYLYIPLGGNRGHQRRNLFLTMVIGGVWHGASWTFLVWGAYHGLLLIAYKELGGAWDRLPGLARRAGMFLLATIGWVFFRAPSLRSAAGMLHKMFVPTGGLAFPAAATLAIMALVAGVIAFRARNTFELTHAWNGLGTFGIVALFSLSLAVIYSGGESPFLYFQF